MPAPPDEDLTYEYQINRANEKFVNAAAAGPFSTDLDAVVEGKRYLLKYRDRTGNVRLCDGALKSVRDPVDGTELTRQWTHPHDMMGLICFPEDAIAVAELNEDVEL